MRVLCCRRHFISNEFNNCNVLQLSLFSFINQNRVSVFVISFTRLESLFNARIVSF